MDEALARFLARQEAVAQDTVTWRWDGRLLRLRAAAYLGREMPPLPAVTSARALLFRGEEVMLLRDADDYLHIMPGGRLEPGETAEAALRREVLEETGWTLTRPSLLGFLHFRHLSPRPPDYRTPYPDFIQLVYTAQAAAHHPQARQPDGYEVEASFCSIHDGRLSGLEVGQRRFLAAALAVNEAC